MLSWVPWGVMVGLWAWECQGQPWVWKDPSGDI